MIVKENRLSHAYVCSLDPKSACDMNDVLNSIKRSISSHNKAVRLSFEMSKRTGTKFNECFKRITVKGREPLDGKRTMFNDIANKYTNSGRLDIYIHRDATATYKMTGEFC